VRQPSEPVFSFERTKENWSDLPIIGFNDVVLPNID
jgi:hypothetical protein